MDETHYSISEAGKLVGVESHVLRYWEDELQLEIPRNGKSHRYYTELHIRLFRKIKELKEKGYQLKAIEQVLKKMLEGDENVDVDEILEQNAVNILKEGSGEDGEGVPGETRLRLVQRQETAEAVNQVNQVNQEKLEQFQEIMNHIITNAIGQAMKQNSEAMSEEISRQVGNHMVQELEYMMRISDEREEERFKMLDETLRSCQKENKGKAEAAATKLPFFKRRRFGRSARKV
ncbi:MAG: helix-turn-helix domain-containing protein [Eubacteriales bacterium]|nr:helix-turn-helix domain-containing protein [Eubacteriales bacterium]